MTYETKKKKTGDETALELHEALEIGTQQAKEVLQRARRSQYTALAVGVAVLGVTASLMLHSTIRVSDAQQLLSRQQETAAAAETQIPIDGATQVARYSGLAQATHDAAIMQQTALPVTIAQAEFEADIASTYAFQYVAPLGTHVADAMKAYPDESRAWLVRGLIELSPYDYGAALDEFNQAIELDPQDDLAYFNRGMMWFFVEDYSRAMTDFSEAIRWNTAFADAYLMRGESFNHLKRYSDALADYESAASRGLLNMARLYFDRGVAYNNLGNYDTALSNLNEAIKLDSQLGEAYVQRGFALYSLKQYQGAVDDYDIAVSLSFHNGDLYFKRANAYFDLGQYDSALADYSMAVQLDPQHAMAYTNRGNIYDKRDQYELAIADFSAAIRINPNDIDSHYKRANTYFVMERYDEAIAGYEDTLRMNPHYNSSYFSLGHVYYRMENYERALEYLDAALSRSASNPAMLYNLRAYTHFKMGHLDQALADVGQAIQLKPNDPNYYDSRCEFYMRSQMWQDGLKDCDKAMSLGWTFSSEMQTLINKARQSVPAITPPSDHKRG